MRQRGVRSPPRTAGGCWGSRETRLREFAPAVLTRTSASTAMVQPVTGVDGEKEKLKAARLSP